MVFQLKPYCANSRLLQDIQMEHGNDMPMVTSNCGKLEQGRYRRTLIMSIHEG